MEYGKEISADHHRLIPMIAAYKLDHHSRKAKAEQQCGNVLFPAVFHLILFGRKAYDVPYSHCCGQTENNQADNCQEYKADYGVDNIVDVIHCQFPLLSDYSIAILKCQYIYIEFQYLFSDKRKDQ